ncbi:MAG TPA: SxtJ family membrane protein [Chthoniobacterales bacterium]|jgi:Saxitoxin biosynthesis operon protein SxtJ|nr:SxtJ family membrane protein [Chthoniobacterales bacterium]
MSILKEIQELKTGARDLRKFGLMVGGVFVALGLLFLLRHKPSYPFLLWPGIILILFGTVAPAALKYVYIAWMSVAFTLGFIMARVLLTICFFLLVTPIALIGRLFGRDFLNRKLHREAMSYWIRCEAGPKKAESYEQQF